MAQRIEERVRERVATALDSEEVQKKIEARLREERTALEQKVVPFVMLSSDIASSLMTANHRRAQLHGRARNLGVRLREELTALEQKVACWLMQPCQQKSAHQT